MWIKNIKFWDGVAEELSEADAIQIEDSRIITVDSSDAVNDKSSIDMNGLVAIPGLIDGHVHMCLNPDLRDALLQGEPDKDTLFGQMIVRAREMLMAGITTARDLGGGQWLELTLRDRINSGDLTGPRLICAGQPVTSIKGHCHFWGGEAKDVTDARKVIEKQIAHGVDLIKIMATGGTLTPGSTPAEAQFDSDSMVEMVRFAQDQDYLVAAHCHGTAGIRNASEAGVNTIEHCSWVGDEGWARAFDLDVVKQIVAKGLWVSPTINAGWQRRIGTEMEDIIRGNYKKMRAEGIKLISSTDAGIPNVRHQDLPKAIPLLAHFAGLSNTEALRAATSNCAEAIGLGDAVGQISAGFEADMVFYEQSPLEDLGELVNPVKIVSRGKFLDQ